ncbi:hypothetical protein KQX54_003104 [Cotesia glomerata]|uniref:Uncharacterized protein n=1 Tax=Cotesia glomerata TaxID=32391 RepID=A0AAV7ISI7_COTGL|nr:hypothetical protein KQX54_003104 [Cotesia glomerata]
MAKTAEEGEPRSSALRASSPSTKLNGLKDGALPWNFTVIRGAKEDGPSQEGPTSGFNSEVNKGFSSEVNSETNGGYSEGHTERSTAQVSGESKVDKAEVEDLEGIDRGDSDKVRGQEATSRCWSGVND